MIYPTLASRLVFHRRRGGSGQIRGTQIAEYLSARINPEQTHPDDVHIYVKLQPPEDFPPKSFLDIIDGKERLGWLKEHPEMGIIASSTTGKIWLQEQLDRYVFLIPQHHCNFDRLHRTKEEVLTAGVIGGLGTLQCDIDELEKRLHALDIEFRWLRRYKTRQDVVDFYMDLDVQIVWRKQQRPLKNPLKLVNAASFGIPTVGYPELGYQEWNGYYTQVKTLQDLADAISVLKQGWDAERLIKRAKKYHIDNIAPLYRGLLA